MEVQDPPVQSPSKSKSKRRGHKPKAIGTFPLGVDSPKHMTHGTSSVNSVESYFKRGIFLGDLLAKQLVLTYKVTRSTQTNWAWRTMAERWKHAPIKSPSKAVREQIEEKRKMDYHMRMVYGVSGQHPRQSGGSLTVRVVGADEDEEEGHVIYDSSRQSVVTKQSSNDVFEPSLISSRILRTSKLKLAGSRTKVGTISLKKLEQAKRAIPTDTILRFVRPNEKTVDTSDLEFNPYDPRMRYTPARSVGAMITEEDEGAQSASDLSTT